MPSLPCTPDSVCLCCGVLLPIPQRGGTLVLCQRGRAPWQRTPPATGSHPPSPSSSSPGSTTRTTEQTSTPAEQQAHRLGSQTTATVPSQTCWGKVPSSHIVYGPTEQSVLQSLVFAPESVANPAAAAAVLGAAGGGWVGYGWFEWGACINPYRTGHAALGRVPAALIEVLIVSLVSGSFRAPRLDRARHRAAALLLVWQQSVCLMARPLFGLA